MDTSFYLLAVAIMSAIFVCGYKIGSHFGWRDGFDTARLLESQHAMGRWRRSLPAKNEKPWDYQPKKNGCSPRHETAEDMTFKQTAA